MRISSAIVRIQEFKLNSNLIIINGQIWHCRVPNKVVEMGVKSQAKETLKFNCRELSFLTLIFLSNQKYLYYSNFTNRIKWLNQFKKCLHDFYYEVVT